MRRVLCPTDKREKSLNLVHRWVQAENGLLLYDSAPKERHRRNPPSGRSLSVFIWHPHSVERDVCIKLYVGMSSKRLIVCEELGGRKIRILETGKLGE